MKKHNHEYRSIVLKEVATYDREFYCIHCLRVISVALYSGRNKDRTIVLYNGLENNQQNEK